MTLPDEQPLADGSFQDLTSLIVGWNDRLENAGRENAGRAFNLGCGLGLLPALAVVVIAYISTSGSWIAAVILSVLMVIALVGFSNLVASISRSGAYRRLYNQDIKSELDRYITAQNIPPSELEQAALTSLSPQAPLLWLLENDRPTSLSRSEDHDDA